MSEESYKYQYLIDAYNKGQNIFRRVSVGKLIRAIDELRAELGEMVEDICNYQAELARRDEIITRLKVAGNNMYFTCSDDPYQVVNMVHEAWCALMKELE